MAAEVDAGISRILEKFVIQILKHEILDGQGGDAHVDDSEGVASVPAFTAASRARPSFPLVARV